MTRAAALPSPAAAQKQGPSLLASKLALWESDPTPQRTPPQLANSVADTPQLVVEVPQSRRVDSIAPSVSATRMLTSSPEHTDSASPSLPPAPPVRTKNRERADSVNSPPSPQPVAALDLVALVSSPIRRSEVAVAPTQRERPRLPFLMPLKVGNAAERRERWQGDDHTREKPFALTARHERPARTRSDEEPTVHIHIGRIEVRAAIPLPARRVAPSPPKPTVSLDDYLNKTRRREP